METRAKTCEACGARFGCGAEVGGCWCDELTLDAATLARLRATYANCLCPACLRAAGSGLAAGPAASAAAADGPAAADAPSQPASIAVISAVPRGDSR